MNSGLEIEVTTVREWDQGVTCAYVSLELDNLFLDETGAAKCMADDTYNSTIGEALALGRALQKIGKRLEKEAFNQVHHLDRVRAQQLEATENLRKRSAEARYQWECEFAELINLKLAENSLEENDVIPEPYPVKSSKKDKKKKKPRGKAFQIRENLPA